jgi:nitrogenase molybdenum-iron protein alpha chain
MEMKSENDTFAPLPSPEEVKQAILDKYPPKVARKRSRQIIINKVEKETEAVPEIEANVRTIPAS